MKFLLLLLLACTFAFAQSAPLAPLAQADLLYRSGKFAEAADAYSALLKLSDNNPAAHAGLARSLLHQQKIDEAYETAAAALRAEPNSALLHAAMGEIQFRRAQMNDAEIQFQAAIHADPLDARAWLGLARLYRVFSLYRKAYDLTKHAHELAPNDPDVQRAWLTQLPRSQRIAALEAYLAAPHPEDADETRNLEQYLEYLKATRDQPVHACRLTSKIDSTDTRLEPLMRDATHVRAYGLDVKLNDHSAKLLLDTGASGIVVGRKTAERANAVRISALSYAGIGDKGPRSGYRALVDTIHIGALEFHDCIIDVSDASNLAEDDGLIGADVFSSYLIDIDFPGRKLRLSPLPKRPDEAVADTALQSQSESAQSAHEDKPADSPSSAAPRPATLRLPKDRYIAPEMKTWSPVFEFGDHILIPTFVNKSGPMLFILDTGAFSNLLSTNAARTVTKIGEDARTRIRGLNGSVGKVYRADQADIQFGRFAQHNTDMVSFDLSRISHSTGTEVSGMLGFEMLSTLEVKIDYRDGLVDFTYDPKRVRQY